MINASDWYSNEKAKRHLSEYMTKNQKFLKKLHGMWLMYLCSDL